MLDKTPTQAAEAWLSTFAGALGQGGGAAAALFTQDGCWRDLLSFTWTVKTTEGRAAIAAREQVLLA